MTEQEIAEINMYCDPYSILIVTNKRRLVRLRCPFSVGVIHSIDTFRVGETKQVQSVKIDRDAQLVYEIERKPYHYSFFRILFVDP